MFCTCVEFNLLVDHRLKASCCDGGVSARGERAKGTPPPNDPNDVVLLPRPEDSQPLLLVPASEALFFSKNPSGRAGEFLYL